MTEVGQAGAYLNFTYDELSPLLGVDPFDMYKAIRSIGVEHVTLSSDCGEPLFSNSVEGMRQMRAYMEAFGLTQGRDQNREWRQPSGNSRIVTGCLEQGARERNRL